MKKQHKFLTILLIIVLCVTLLSTLIACTKDNTNTEEVKDSSEFIANGNFEVTTSDIFPKVPGSWTGSAGSTSSGNETETDDDALVAGVIDTTDEIYEKNKKTWNRLANPGAVAKTDSNILMIYNKKNNSYKYTSSSFNLDANKIFRIDISVKTVNIPADSYGAYIKIGNDAFIEFERIKTNGAWLTYSAMIRTSNISSNSLNVVLSNGKDGKKDNNLSQGYVFFDNVVVTEVTGTENGDTAEQKFEKFNESATQKKDDLILGDYSFKNISGSSNPYSARKWTGISSSGSDGETAPTGSVYLEKGIVDKNAKGVPEIANDVSPKGKDSKFLMIYNKKPTAYGYRTDNKIKITASDSEYYKLTVWVYTKEIKSTNGAYIRLKTSTDKDEQIFSLNGIISDKEWTPVEIIIKPDARRSKEIYLQLGLGTGGKNDTAENEQGVAFFDEISLTNATSQDYNDAVAEKRAVDLKSTINGANLIQDADIYTKSNYVEGKYNKNDGITARGELNISNKEITITNNTPTITRYKYNVPFKIAPYNNYRLSLNIKTDIYDDNKGVDIKLYKKVDSTGTKDIELTSITNFNLENVDENKQDNGYVEFVFLIQGDLKEETEVYFEVIMGSGTNLTPDTLVKGSVSMKNFELYNINFSDYNSESGDYVKKHSFKEDGSRTISNGEFNLIDISATKTQYEKMDEEFDEENFLIDNNTKGIFGLPESWTSSSKDEMTKIYAGIFDTENASQKSKLGITGSIPKIPNVGNEKNNTLAISTNKAGSQADKPWGFTSPSISLSKGKYYELSVWMYLVDGTATINVKSASKTNIASFTVNSTTTTQWVEYKFYINAGFDNSTIYLELKVGDNNEDSTAEGIVLFDTVNIIDTLTAEDFEFFKKEIDSSNNTMQAITLSTITFDNATASSDASTLDTPDGWTGSHADSDAPSGEHKSIAGVYNRLHGNLNWFGGEYEDGKSNKPITEEKIASIMDSAPYLKIEDDEDKEEINGINSGVNNNNVLVIHNNAASEYTYTTTLADDSLTQNKYYEISLYVLTYKLASDQNAKIKLKLHNTTYEFSKNDARGIKVNTNTSTSEKWVRYSFFISTKENADIDKVELSVSLGASGKDNYVSGYLFVDNISISEISETRFEAKVPENKFPATSEEEADFKFDKAYSSTNHRIVFTAEELKKDEEVEEEKKETDPYLWLYITSGVIGGLIIIVVAVFLFRRFNLFEKFTKKSNYGEKGNESYNRNRVEANKANAQKRDINKKHQD